MCLVVGGGAAVQAQKGKARAEAVRSTPRFLEYQVPAGTTLAIELRTAVGSNTSRVTDEIRGRLLHALASADGTELVPAGAMVLGTVREAEAAGRTRGRVAFTFHVVEHPETGSRAMIKATVRSFESELPLKGKIFAEVRLERGADASVLLLAPLLVRIPAN